MDADAETPADAADDEEVRGAFAVVGDVGAAPSAAVHGVVEAAGGASQRSRAMESHVVAGPSKR